MGNTDTVSGRLPKEIAFIPFLFCFIAKDSQNLGIGMENRHRDAFFGSLVSGASVNIFVLLQFFLSTGALFGVGTCISKRRFLYFLVIRKILQITSNFSPQQRSGSLNLIGSEKSI